MGKPEDRDFFDLTNTIRNAARDCMEKLGRDIADLLETDVIVEPPRLICGKDQTGHYLDIAFRTRVKP